MTAQLEILIKAQLGEATAALKAIEGQLKDLREEQKRVREEQKKSTDQLKGMLRDVEHWAKGLLSAGVAIKLVSDSLKEQAAQEAAVNKLNLALANQGRYSKETSRALQDYAAELQDITIYSDDAILSGEALLATFDLSETEIKRTTKAALNYAAATGTELQAAFQLLGKASAGSVTGLQKQGFQFRQGASDAEKFESALQQIDQRFSGSAQAATASYSGQLAQLQNQIGEAKEGFGKLLGELLGGERPFSLATGWVRSLARVLSDDAIVALSEFRARWLETMADIVGGKIGGFLANQKAGPLLGLASMLGIAGSDKKDLANFAAELRKQAVAIRESGDAAAKSAGKTLEFANKTTQGARASREAAEAARKHAEELKKLRDEFAKLFGSGLQEERTKRLTAFWDVISRDIQNISHKELPVLIAKLKEFGEEGEAAAQQFVDAWNDVNGVVTITASRPISGLAPADPRDKRPPLDNVPSGMTPDDWLAWLEESRKRSIDWSRSLQDLAHAWQALGIAATSALSQMTIQAAQGLSLAKQIKELMDGRSFGKLKGGEKAQIGLAGIGVAASAYEGGSILGGAAGGAAFGSAFGPWGTAIGAVAGGLLGFLGKGAKERKELEALRKQMVEAHGSMEQLRKTARQLGVDIERAFTTKKPEEAKRIFEDLERAAREQKKTLEGLGKASGGLELFTKGGGDVKNAGQYAVAIFAGMVKETGDVIGALNQLGPSLDDIIAKQEELGIEGSVSLRQLMGMREILVNNEALGQQISGLQQLMSGLGDANAITKDLFVAFGQDAVSQFNQILGAGGDTNKALAMMQPTLQALWENQQKFGASTDEATNSLIAMAEEQGIVGNQFRSVNEQILTVLLAIGDALGAKLPEDMRTFGVSASQTFTATVNEAHTFGGEIQKEFQGMGHAAKTTFDAISADIGGSMAQWKGAAEGAAKDVTDALLELPRGVRIPIEFPVTPPDTSGWWWTNPGGTDTGSTPGLAHGGIVAPAWWSMPRAATGIVVPPRPGRGTPVVLGEANSAEVAAPVTALFGTLGDMIAAKVAAAVAAARPGGDVYLDGVKVGRVLGELTRRGDLRVHPSAVTASGF
jgi:hypothetical protein